MRWEACKTYSSPPHGERVKDLNVYQFAWTHLNIEKDKEELQQMIYDFLNWFKWFVNPTMAEKVDQMEKEGIAVEDEDYVAMVADGFRREGKSEEEIYNMLLSAGLITEE